MENTKYDFLKQIFGDYLGSSLIKLAQNEQRMGIFFALVIFLFVVLAILIVSAIVSLGSIL